MGITGGVMEDESNKDIVESFRKTIADSPLTDLVFETAAIRLHVGSLPSGQNQSFPNLQACYGRPSFHARG
jgi:hypothetical protein